MQRDAVGAQDAPERQNQRGAGPGQLQRGSRALGPRPADVGVVEEQGARPASAPPCWARGLKAAGSGCMCATGGGPPGSSARRNRPGSHRAAGSALTTSRPRPSTTGEGGKAGAVGGRDEEHEVEGAAHHRFEPTTVVQQERPEQRADERAEAQPRLGHGRLLVPEQHRVERARQRAEPRRRDGSERDAETARHDAAGEAEAPVTAGGTPADAADPGPGVGHAERVRRRERNPCRVRGRVDAGERSQWPG